MGKISDALEKADYSKPEPGIDEPQKKNNPPNQAKDLSHPKQIKKDEAANDHVALTQTKISSGNLHNSLITLKDPESAASEQFRLLKNNILFPEKGMPPRCLMITSPSASEGKSFVAANLAVTIARSIDEYVLLMDCDLRAPTIHSIFELSQPHGLSDHLTRGIGLSSLMCKTFIPKLTVLPAGKIPVNPSELLSSEKMRSLVREVALRYADRYVIIDAPPPYLTSEASVLARQADAIIIVIKNGKTRLKDVQDIIEICGKEKILGVVQNFAEKRPGHGYGYYKYGYGK